MSSFPVTEYVIDRIDNFEELNAPTSDEANVKFSKILSQAIAHEEVGKVLGHGDYLLTNELSNPEHKHVVIKRLRINNRKMIESGLGPEVFFEKLKEEHELIVSYFGDFVPQTEFVIVEGNFSDPSPEYAEVQTGREYVMVQQRVDGVDGMDIIYYDEDVVLSEPLKGRLKEFVERYRAMMVDGYVIEDQFIVDYEHGNVYVLDTNNLVRRDDLLRDNPLVGENPHQTANELIDILSQLPGLEGLNLLPYIEILRILSPNSDERHYLHEYLSSVMSELPTKGTKIGRHINDFLDAIIYFPPQDQKDNFITSNLVRKFELE